MFTGGGIGALANYDTLSAIPAYLALAGGDITALNDLDALSAINPYLALAGGDITALNDLDSLSAINPYLALAGGDITATGDLDSVSAVDTFFGDGPDGRSVGVFTGGGIDALAPDADGNGGYAALSALPVFFGPDTSGTPFGPGVFTGGGIRRAVQLRCAERYSGVPQPSRDAWPRRQSRRRTSRRHRRGSLQDPAPDIDAADRFQPGAEVRGLAYARRSHHRRRRCLPRRHLRRRSRRSRRRRLRGTTVGRTSKHRPGLEEGHTDRASWR